MSDIERTSASYPLTIAQKGMLLHSFKAPFSGTYVQQLVITLAEPLDINAWESAWQKVVERHEILRMRFNLEDLEFPFQEVVSGVIKTASVHDWQSLPTEDCEARFNAFLQEDRFFGFDFSELPPWRWSLFCINGKDSRWIWTSHHALFDGRTRFLLIEELFTLYDAFRDGRMVELEKPHPVGNYLLWAANLNDSPARSYWTDLLQGFSQPTPLPLCEKEKSVPEESAAHQSIEFSLTPEQTRNLQILAEENDLTLNNLLQGTWALILGYYSGQSDVVFGATRACRHVPLEGAESIAGLLINTLPLRVEIPGNAPLIHWLEDLRAQWVKMRDYETTSLVNIIDWSEIGRGEPLFESIVVFEKFKLEEALWERNSAWRSRKLRLRGITHYPLIIAGYLGSELSVQVTVDRMRLDEEVVGRMVGSLRMVLQNMDKYSHTPLAEIPLLEPRLREKIVREWNRTEVSIPEASIAKLFEDQVARRPDALALIHQDFLMSYATLNRLSNGLAYRLRELGVAHETPVAILSERSPELIIGLLAILKAGGLYVPLDPDFPQERIDLILKDTGSPVLLYQSGCELPETPAGVRCLSLGKNDAVNHIHGDNNIDCPATPESRAYIIYTSGSTGTPRGVVVAQRAVVRLVSDAGYAHLEPGQRIGCAASIAFDAAVFEIWGALLRGGTCVLVPGRLPDLGVIERTLNQGEVDTLFLTTSLFNTIIDENPEILSGVRQLLFGGEEHSPDHVGRALAALPHTEIIHVYGPTEATTFATFHKVEKRPPSMSRRIPIGKPIGNTTACLVDSLGRLVPPGVVGEIFLGGSGIAEGYLNQPELTKDRFVSDFFNPVLGARLFRTGDFGRYRSDGNVEFFGRIDDQVKVRGFRIEPAEVEVALLSHPNVRKTVVLAHENQDNPGRRLVAYIVVDLAPDQVSAIDFRGFMEDKLPWYMIPMHFVFLDELPLTTSGKVDRMRLPIAGIDLSNERQTRNDGPTTELERQLVDIVQELLNRNDVGVNDRLLDLGLDSLAAMRMVSSVHKRTGKKLKIFDLFRLQTIALIAEKLSSTEVDYSQE
jgi:surfactin family lipopeptide synthetase C